MTDLNKIGSGMKLLNYILKKENKNRPWTNEAIVKKLANKPNTNKNKPK